MPLSPASAARQVEGASLPERRDRSEAGDGDAAHGAQLRPRSGLREDG